MAKNQKTVDTLKIVGADTKNNNLILAQKDESSSETPALNILRDLLQYEVHEDPQGAFFLLTTHKVYLRKKDLMDATGLSKRRLDKIFDNQHSPEWRLPKYDDEAILALTEHLEREDLSLHQWLFSNLLFKQMQFFAMKRILDHLEILLGEGAVGNLAENDDFDLDTYRINAEELEEATGYLMVHILDCEEQVDVA